MEPLLTSHETPENPIPAFVDLENAPNGGMHASIYIKVWGDAGGGDVGRIALANYAYELGKRAGILIAAQNALAAKTMPELAVVYCDMPESNGRSNWTATLVRKSDTGFDSIGNGFSFSRSEYPDRVRYEADCMRFLIGEIDEEPCILDYDDQKHSGYAGID